MTAEEKSANTQVTMESPTNSSQNITCQIDKTFTSLYLPSVYVCVFVVGFLGNSCGLYRLVQNWKKWASINVFVLNLGIADLLYVATLPFLVDYYVQGEWHFGDTFCRITRFLFHLNLQCSIAFLTCISVNRYLGIVHPMKVLGKLRLRWSVMASLLVWICIIAQVAPQMHFIHLRSDGKVCFDTASDEVLATYRIYSVLNSAAGFAIPFAIILACYSHVAVVLVRNKNVDRSLKQKCLRLVIIVTILFSLCFIPYCIFRNLNLLARQVNQTAKVCNKTSKIIYLIYQVTRGLASLNSAVNPLVYLVTNEKIIGKVKRFGQQAKRSIAYFSVRSMLSNPAQEMSESTSYEA
ncbi:P2Y purinoceptor 1-like [Protopterus annectens]|uniref:P2Y purinoceptor 1-like n=1 Tax=Protopterus annectens TaxID=7888 RepID=UPI001CF9AB43|nr:P2Y purinoceptor 1-like [Protopterus annectens]